MAPPHGGPDAVLREATTALHVINEVSTPQEARGAVQAMASRQPQEELAGLESMRAGLAGPVNGLMNAPAALETPSAAAADAKYR